MLWASLGLTLRLLTLALEWWPSNVVGSDVWGPHAEQTCTVAKGMSVVAAGSQQIGSKLQQMMNLVIWSQKHLLSSNGCLSISLLDTQGA